MSRVALTETILVATNPASFARGREVMVFDRGTEDEATLHTAETGGVTLAQPLITDEGGRPRGDGDVLAWLDPGSYDLRVAPAMDGEDPAILPWEAAEGAGIPDLSGYQETDEKGEPGGYAGLDGGGKVEAAALPALALTDVSTVANQAAQLALSAQEGDVAVRTDQSKSYIHNGGSAGTMADWTELATPADSVLSVAGKTGAVTLAQSDISGLVAALEGKQSLDSDLTAIAALSTTSFGRGLLALADAAAGRTAFGLGTAATQATGAFDAAGAAAAAQAASQPLDSDLTAIAALSTTSFGRSLLALANATALREAAEAQPVDSDLTAIAALSTTAFGRSLLTQASAEAARSTLGLMPATIGCLAKRATEQTITKETVTALSFSETEFDDGDCWVIGNPTRLTVPASQGGLYLVQWTTTILPSSLSGEKEIWFRLNGNEKLRIATTDYVGPADMQTLTAIPRLSAGDYIECCAYLETTENGKFAKDEYNVADDLQRCRFERIR